MSAAEEQAVLEDALLDAGLPPERARLAAEAAFWSPSFDAREAYRKWRRERLEDLPGRVAARRQTEEPPAPLGDLLPQPRQTVALGNLNGLFKEVYSEAFEDLGPWRTR